MSAISTTDIEKLVAKSVKVQVKQIMATNKKYDKKNHSNHRGNNKSGGDDKAILFSQGKMKNLYTDAQWEHRLTNVKNKVPPTDNPEVYDKDCYSTNEDGTGPWDDAKPACEYCRKLGHTLLNCTHLAKRARK